MAKMSSIDMSRAHEFVKRFRDLGLCTEPSYRPMAESAIRTMYECAGLPHPKRIEWRSSPYDLVTNATLDPEHEASSASVSDCCYGQHEAGWLSFYSYFREVVGLVSETDKMQGLFELAKSAGWALCYENVAYVSERPTKIHLDNLGRLHALDSAAIEYPDGWGVYAVRGVRVKKDWVLNRSKLDPMIALTEPNLELRSAAAILIGWDRVLEKLSPRVVDSELGVQGPYGYCMGELLEVDMPGQSGQKFLRVMWGKEQQAVLRVPPDMKTARQANQWTYPLNWGNAGFFPEGRT